MTEEQSDLADLAYLDRLPASMRQPIQSYAQRVQAMAGPNALALTLFGALAAGTFDPKRHTARSVLVLQTVDLELLRLLAKEGPRLGKARIAAPLIMTPDYIKGSADSFPLELLEIQQRHLCVFGPDYFEELAIQENHIRLQCERELKSILIGMRQALLAAAGKDKLLSEIEADVAERLIRTLRGLLWLHGQRDPKPAGQAVSEIERSISRDLPGVRGAINERGKHGWEEFKTLYEEVDALRKSVDAW